MINVYVNALKGEGSMYSFPKIISFIANDITTKKVYIIDKSYEFKCENVFRHVGDMDYIIKEKQINFPHYQTVALTQKVRLESAPDNISLLTLWISDIMEQIDLSQKITVISVDDIPCNVMDDFICEIKKSLEIMSEPNCYQQTYCFIHERSKE